MTYKRFLFFARVFQWSKTPDFWRKTPKSDRLLAWLERLVRLQSFDRLGFFEIVSFGFNPGLEVCLWVQAKARRFNGEYRNKTAKTQKLRNGKGMLHALARL